MKRKRVYVAYTGGTIGMMPSDRGFAPKPGYFTDLIMKLPELTLSGSESSEIPEIVMHEYENLIDSSDITPDDWYNISQDIESKYDEFDGFVVLHGTDTMAYTASALSFMLEDLSKPVIVTGSQIPWSQMRTDAKENLITSLILAANYDIPEVCLYFHNKLYRGNRARKVDANGFHAFQSPNFPALADVGSKINLREELIFKENTSRLKIQKISPPKVIILSLFPGFPSEMLESILSTSIKGIVLMTYGMGNAPSNDKKLMSLLNQASENGVVIVNCTQCYKGSVDMSGYATGHALQAAGVISGFDMTPEATLTKLSYLLSCNYSVEEVKQKMQTNLRGELTKI
jgi:L-asparaginase